MSAFPANDRITRSLPSLTCIARFTMIAQKYKTHYENAVDDGHARLPKPSVPHSLPLTSYTGTYHHPAYQNITVSLCNGTLVADFRRWTSPCRLALIHLTGEAFVVQDKPRASSMLGWVSVGEFNVKHSKPTAPERGVALSLNIILEKTMGRGAIAFRRVSWGGDDAHC